MSHQPKAVVSTQRIASPSCSTTDPAFEASSGQPFGPVVDTPGRPYLRPHRMAQVTRDPEMLQALRTPDYRRDGTLHALALIAVVIGIPACCAVVALWMYAV